MSYSGLVLDGDHTKPTHELLLNMIEFNIERGAAERKDSSRRIDDFAVLEFLDEGFVAGLLDQLSDAVYGAIQIADFALSLARRRVQHLGWAIGVDVELENRRALRTETSLVVRAAGIAFNVDDLAVDCVDERRATD